MPQLSFTRQATLVMLVAVLAFGCQKKTPSPDSPTPAPPVAAHTGPPLTDADYQEFGEKLETAIATGDQAEASRLFRLMDLFERCLTDLDFSAADKRGLLQGAGASSGKMAEQIIQEVKKGGKYSLLRVRTVEGKKRVLMRLIGAEGALNYHEFTLVRYPDGRVGPEDIHILATGELITQTFRRLLLSFAAERNQGIVARLSGAEQMYTKHLPKLQTIAQDTQAGRHQQALATFRQLPAELQKDRTFQILAIQAAQGVDEKEYLAEMERFQQNHPGDPVTDLLAIDFFLVKKQYDESIKAIDRLDKMMGGDPYICVLRGGALLEAGRLEEARKETEKGIKEDPKLEAGYLARIKVAFREKNHPDALVWLKKAVENANLALDLDAEKSNPEWADFIKSPQFGQLRKWLEKRSK